MALSSSDGNLIATAIKDGRALLVLGAGASSGCTNRYGRKLMGGVQLAEFIAMKCGEAYQDDLLSDVMEVAYDKLGVKQAAQLVLDQYSSCTPSDDLVALFSIPWKRVYTFNVDDAISRIPRKFLAQDLQIINGRAEKKQTEDSPNVLQIIHLHGRCDNVDAGIVFSKREYLKALTTSRLEWYEQAATDYESYVPIFIGSKLDEDVLFSEIERINRSGSSIGIAFAFSPDALSPIRKKSLEARGIHHCSMSLADFNSWLKSQFPAGISTSEIVESKGFQNLPLEQVSRGDLDHLLCVRPVRLVDISDDVSRLSDEQRRVLGRSFFRGFPISWGSVALGHPVEFSGDRRFVDFVSTEISSSSGQCVVLRGAAGSGKSTLLKRAVYESMRAGTSHVVFELVNNPKSISKTLDVLKRLYPTNTIVVVVDDYFLYAADFAEVAGRQEYSQFVFLGSVRRGDWGGRAVKYIGKYTSLFDQKEIDSPDVEKILSRLTTFIPSPYFQNLGASERRRIFANARRQLLIGMVEVTREGRFQDIVLDEFDRIPERGAKALFCVIGIATLARVGISKEFARACYSRVEADSKFEDALKMLDGIVLVRSDGRIVSRHEVYVREVFHGMSDFPVWVDALSSLMREFASHRAPVIRNVSRQDGQLFRYAINHSNIAKAFRRKSTVQAGEALYENLEIELQLDGHYWLQYGLYVQEIGQIEKCVDLLRRSIDAYPGNNFARHALAFSQLKLAKTLNRYEGRAENLVEDAIAVLLELDARPDEQSDHYPIWTLVHGHLGVLVRFDMRGKFREVAKGYFERVKQKRNFTTSEYLDNCYETLFRSLSLSDWPPAPFDRSGDTRGGSRFKFGDS